MDQPNFVIESRRAETMAQSLGLPSVLHLLPTLVQPAQSLARPPISNYHVGAVGLGYDGRVFLGVNLEFPGLPLHHSVHAEQFLVTNLAIHRCSRLLALAVSAAPCGHCRQFLQELRHSSSMKIFIASQHKAHLDGNKQPNFDFTFKPLIELLPDPFGPYDLLDEEMPLLLEEQKNGLFLSTNLTKSTLLSNGFCELSVEEYPKRTDLYVNSQKLSNGICEKLKNSDTLLSEEAAEAINHSHALRCRLSAEEESGSLNLYTNNENLSNGFCEKVEKNETLLVVEALEAANNSHAPYSECPSGVALMDCGGKVYRGSYAESAAYNPSIGPVQAALVAYVAGGGGGYDRIVAAVLVEKEGKQVAQEDTARLILKNVAPKCDFKVFYCCSGKK